MVTIGKFHSQESAELEAGRLRELGLEVHVICGNGSGWLNYIESGFELQVEHDQLAQLSQLEESVLENRPHRCPDCGSANYENFVSFSDHFRALVFSILSLIRMLTKIRLDGIGDDTIAFRCRSCGSKFEIKIDSTN